MESKKMNDEKARVTVKRCKCGLYPIIDMAIIGYCVMCLKCHIHITGYETVERAIVAWNHMVKSKAVASD